MGTSTSKDKYVNKNETFEFGSYKSVKNPRPGYFITKKNVYYRGLTLHDADVETFEKLSKGWAQDKKGYYYKGKRTKNTPPK